MGNSLAWVAVHREDSQLLYDALGVRTSGEQAEYAEGPLTTTHTASGWTVVVANLAAGGDDRLVDEDFVAGLSRLGPAVWCFLDEHTMRSEAVGCDRGNKRWSVRHNPEQGRRHLAAVGAVPAELEQLESKLRALQNAEGGESVDVDHLFDAPIHLAEVLTGFRHDADDHGAAYETLTHTVTPNGLPPTSSCAAVSNFTLAAYDFDGEAKALRGDVTGFLGRLHFMLLQVAVEEAEFFILTGKEESFMQTAAAQSEDGRLVLEWQRASSNGDRRHYRIVRRPGPFAPGEKAPIEFVVEEVLEHLRSFAQRGIPGANAFLLDVTHEVPGPSDEAGSSPKPWWKVW